MNLNQKPLKYSFNCKINLIKFENVALKNAKYFC